MLSPRVLLPVGALLLLLLGTAAQCPPPAGQAPAGEALTAPYPAIEPFDSGHLQVDELHSIYYERCGNPEGLPVVVLHGGPGVGSYPQLRRYFDPERYHIVLHDQRGAGRSTPKGELRGNTTQDLVADMVEVTKAHGSSFESEKVVLSPMLSVDAESEKFVGDHADVANRFLKREYREPYVVPRIDS